MRIIVIPQPILLPDLIDQRTKKPVEMSLAVLFEFTLALDLFWRQSDEHMVAKLEIIAALKGKEPGTLLELEDGHVEKTIACYKIFQGIRPEADAAVTSLMRTFTMAQKTATPGLEDRSKKKA